jgi:glutaredoxin
MADAPVTLYQAEWCPFSSAVRELLTELGIDAVVRQVEPWPEQRDRLREVAGTDEIPAWSPRTGRSSAAPGRSSPTSRPGRRAGSLPITAAATPSTGRPAATRPAGGCCSTSIAPPGRNAPHRHVLAHRGS